MTARCVVCGKPVMAEHNRVHVVLDGIYADLHWWCLSELLGDEAIVRTEERIAADGRRIQRGRLQLVPARGEKYQDEPD